MAAKPVTPNPAPLSRASWLKRALPFESAAVRYALLLWLAVGCLAAGWAHFYAKPTRLQNQAFHAELFDLESQVASSDSDALDEALATLRAEKAAAGQTLFADQEDAERQLAHAIENLQSRGWRAQLVPSNEARALGSFIEKRSYNLELQRHRSSAPSRIVEVTLTETATDELVNSLAAIAKPGKGKLEIERFVATVDSDGRLKTQLELSAYLIIGR